MKGVNKLRYLENNTKCKYLFNFPTKIFGLYSREIKIKVIRTEILPTFVYVVLK